MKKPTDINTFLLLVSRILSAPHACLSASGSGTGMRVLERDGSDTALSQKDPSDATKAMCEGKNVDKRAD